MRRSKSGTPSVHPIRGDELRALRRPQREQAPSPHLFASERGGPMTPKSFHTLIARLGERAGMPFPIHPHMLRHACRYALANAGHDTLSPPKLHAARLGRRQGVLSAPADQRALLLRGCGWAQTYLSVSRRPRCCRAASLASLLRINTKAIAIPTASATTISRPNSRILILASIPITAAAATPNPSAAKAARPAHNNFVSVSELFWS